MDKTPLILSSTLIAFWAIANLVRFIWDIPVALGTFILPGWTGAILFILAGALAAWSFRSLRN